MFPKIMRGFFYKILRALNAFNDWLQHPRHAESGFLFVIDICLILFITLVIVWASLALLLFLYKLVNLIYEKVQSNAKRALLLITLSAYVSFCLLSAGSLHLYSGNTVQILATFPDLEPLVNLNVILEMLDLRSGYPIIKAPLSYPTGWSLVMLAVFVMVFVMVFTASIAFFMAVISYFFLCRYVVPRKKPLWRTWVIWYGLTVFIFLFAYCLVRYGVSRPDLVDKWVFLEPLIHYAENLFTAVNYVLFLVNCDKEQILFSSINLVINGFWSIILPALFYLIYFFLTNWLWP